MMKITQSNITGIERYSRGRWVAPRHEPTRAGDILLMWSMVLVCVAVALWMT